MLALHLTVPEVKAMSKKYHFSLINILSIQKKSYIEASWTVSNIKRIPEPVENKNHTSRLNVGDENFFNANWRQPKFIIFFFPPPNHKLAPHTSYWCSVQPTRAPDTLPPAMKSKSKPFLTKKKVQIMKCRSSYASTCDTLPSLEAISSHHLPFSKLTETNKSRCRKIIVGERIYEWKN